MLHWLLRPFVGFGAARLSRPSALVFGLGPSAMLFLLLFSLVLQLAAQLFRIHVGKTSVAFLFARGGASAALLRSLVEAAGQTARLAVRYIRAAFGAI